VPEQLWPVSILVLGLLALVVLLIGALQRERGKASRASRARVRRAQRGEREAVALLEAQGYRVLEEQARGTWTVQVDDEQYQADLYADLLVERDGLIFLAEVKTGEVAPDPTRPATRRQLLEYLLAFQPDGLLLVDMEAGEIREVWFPGLEE
jgi:hypothetical protein